MDEASKNPLIDEKVLGMGINSPWDAGGFSSQALSCVCAFRVCNVARGARPRPSVLV